MDQDSKDELKIDIDYEKARLAQENRKINEFNEKHNIKHDEAPSVIPKIKTDDVQADLADIMDKIIKKSLNKQQAKQKKTKIIISSIAAVSLATMFIEIGIPLIKEGINHIKREQELNAAVAFMDEYYLPSVYQRSGFKINIDDKGKPVYIYDNNNLNKAVEILTEEFNLDKNQAILLINKSLDYEAYSNEYFEQLGYKTKDRFNELLPNHTPSNIFENMNEVKLVEQINNIKASLNYADNTNGYTLTSSSTYNINDNLQTEEGVKNARN